MDEEIQAIVNALEGLLFYNVCAYSLFGESEITTICTYRSKEALEKTYKEASIKCNIYRISFMDVIEYHEVYFPIYCPELGGNYKYIDDLARDLMISKLSGIGE